MTPSPTDLARSISRHREAAGLTLAALGDAIGVPRSTILRLERGEIEAPDPDKIERIAAALGLAPEELFAHYPAPERLPGMAPYLRAKFGMSAEAVEEAEQFFAGLTKKKSSKGARRAKRAR